MVSHFHRRRRRPRIAPGAWETAAVLLLAWAAGCDFQAGSGKFLPPANAGNDDTALEPVFSSIQANIFTPRCALSGCHGGGGVLGLSLDAAVSYGNLVEVPSVERPELFRVEPGNPDESYLVKKIQGDADIAGARMPLNGPPFLTSAQIGAIRRWIADGALDDRVSSLSDGGGSHARARVALARGARRAVAHAVSATDASPPVGATGDEEAWAAIAETRLARIVPPRERRRLLELAYARVSLALDGTRQIGWTWLQAAVELSDALEDAWPAVNPLACALRDDVRRRSDTLADPPGFEEAARAIEVLVRLGRCSGGDAAPVRERIERIREWLDALEARSETERAETFRALVFASWLSEEPFTDLGSPEGPIAEPSEEDDLAAVLAGWDACLWAGPESGARLRWDLLLDALQRADRRDGRLRAELVSAFRPEALGLVPTRRGLSLLARERAPE